MRKVCLRSLSEGMAVGRCRCASRDAGPGGPRGSVRDYRGRFGWGNKVTPFQNAGVMWDRRIWTRKVEPNYDGKHQMLGELLVPDDEVPESFFIPKSQIPQWEYLKGANAKLDARRTVTSTSNGRRIAFPIDVDQPSRTILTGEGGSTLPASSTSSKTPSGRVPSPRAQGVGTTEWFRG